MAKKIINNVYETSNSIENIDVVVSTKAKELYAQLLSCNDNAKVRQIVTNNLCVELCKCFKIKNVTEVRICNTQQDSKTVNGVCVRKTMGKYIVNQNMIVVFNKTAVRKQIVAIKSFSDTFLHEFAHVLDHLYYNFATSPHTTGFYKRISSLKQKLST